MRAFELIAQKLVEGLSANFLCLALCGAFELGAGKLQKGRTQIFFVFSFLWSFQIWSSKAPTRAKRNFFCAQPFWSFYGLAKAKMRLAFYGSLKQLAWELHERPKQFLFILPFMELLSFKLGGSIRGYAKKQFLNL